MRAKCPICDPTILDYPAPDIRIEPCPRHPSEKVRGTTPRDVLMPEWSFPYLACQVAMWAHGIATVYGLESDSRLATSIVYRAWAWRDLGDDDFTVGVTEWSRLVELVVKPGTNGPFRRSLRERWHMWHPLG